MKKTAKLRKMINEGKTVVGVGAQDALSGLLVQRAGFDAVYVGSYSTEASFLGKPDLALMSKTERLLLVRNVVKAVDVPVIADMEEGYGNAISVMDSIRDFEDAGVAGIHIDDEQLPCKCPFLPGIPRNQLISVDEMCGKIEAAVDARQDPDFLIIARCDTIGTVPLETYYEKNMIEDVVERSNAYVDAGADGIMLMALNVGEMEYFAKRIKGLRVGLFAPMEPIAIKEFERTGYAMTIGSIATLYMYVRGLLDGLKKLYETGDWNEIADHISTDDEFYEVLGLQDYRAFYDKYRIP